MSTPGVTISPSATPGSGRRYVGTSQGPSYGRSRRGRRLLLLGAIVVLVLLTVIIVPPAVVLTRDSKNKAAQGNVWTTVIDGQTRTITGDLITRTGVSTLPNGEVTTFISVLALPDADRICFVFARGFPHSHIRVAESSSDVGSPCVEFSSSLPAAIFVARCFALSAEFCGDDSGRAHQSRTKLARADTAGVVSRLVGAASVAACLAVISGFAFFTFKPRRRRPDHASAGFSHLRQRFAFQPVELARRKHSLHRPRYQPSAGMYTQTDELPLPDVVPVAEQPPRKRDDLHRARDQSSARMHACADELSLADQLPRRRDDLHRARDQSPSGLHTQADEPSAGLYACTNTGADYSGGRKPADELAFPHFIAVKLSGRRDPPDRSQQVKQLVLAFFFSPLIAAGFVFLAVFLVLANCSVVFAVQPSDPLSVIVVFVFLIFATEVIALPLFSGVES
ncbi:hypothetical protein JCM6882_000705 [Rhodosporidiobolus microsporus]